MPTIADYFKYATLQMAAEAFLKDPKTGDDNYTGNLLIDALKAGNNHASFFVETEAEKFANQWEVLAQQPNTASGFSGTLFRCKVTDESHGLTEGELVLSFRSTEFVDDAVNDNQATNKTISDYGWAFGQIADMEAWYATLTAENGPLAQKGFAVTGYSLGGRGRRRFLL
jgi:hypothetical protein